MMIADRVLICFGGRVADAKADTPSFADPILALFLLIPYHGHSCALFLADERFHQTEL